MSPKSNLQSLIIIQARMRSSRLPGKILMEIDNQPSIIYQINRITPILNKETKLIIATTKNSPDDDLCDLLETQDIEFHRGSEVDVLGRFIECMKKYPSNEVIRLNADCPLICPEVIEKTILTLRENNECDYSSTILDETYPLGMHVEAMTYSTLIKCDELSHSQAEREHVTPYIYNNPEIFNLYPVRNMIDGSKHRITCDYEVDLKMIRYIANHFSGRNFTCNDIIHFLDDHPEISGINSHLMKSQTLS